MSKKKAVVLCIVAAVFSAFPIWRRYVWWGYRSSDKACVRIARRHYPLRHLHWSGIFPLEGGFIPDPHYSSSEVMPVPVSAASYLPSHPSEYQVLEVNSGFDDASSEILLLIRSGDSTFVCPLDFPKGQGVQAVLAYPMAPAARMFPYNDGLAFAANFFGPVKGIYLLPMPLKSGAVLKFIPTSSPEFDRIAKGLRNFRADRTLRSQFCETKEHPFIAFYERYSGPCGEGNRNAEDENTFSEFWLKHQP